MLTCTRTSSYYFGSQRIAMRQGPPGQAGTVYYLHTDHLGSTTLLSDPFGSQVPGSVVRYRPHGEPRYAIGEFPTDRLFTSQRWVSPLALYDYRARFYDPSLGRFLQPDPLVPQPGNPQGARP